MCLPVLVSSAPSQFRLGCHQLPIVALRNNNIPQAQRLCVKCASGALGDEQHLIFNCPFVACVRAEYAHLFYARVHHAGVHAAAGHSQRGLLHSRMPKDLPCLMSQVSLDLWVWDGLLARLTPVA